MTAVELHVNQGLWRIEYLNTGRASSCSVCYQW